MVYFIASSLARAAGFRAAEILCAREFVSAVVDHVVTGERGYNNGPQFVDFYLHKDCGQDQEGLHDVGGDHDAEGNETERRFTGKPGFRPSQSRLDRADEFLPARGPLHQQLGSCVWGLNGLFEFESRAHAGS
jgi:hypothetical protein